MGLIEKMFETGAVRMGPSRTDPSRQVATFDPAAIGRLAADRRTALEAFRWLEGAWTYENPVPATRLSPAYCDVGTAVFAPDSGGSWICRVAPDGQAIPLITFDPWSQQWIYVLTHGSYGVLRAPGWQDDRIAFTGTMTMLGVTCEWRMTWTRHDPDAFAFVNEERAPDGSWSYIDEWRYRRTTTPPGEPPARLPR